MGIKFIKKKKTEAAAAKTTSEIKQAVDKDGKMEIVSKNFKMTASQPPKSEPETVQGSAWTCWGCGHINTGESCSVCGKKRVRS